MKKLFLLPTAILATSCTNPTLQAGPNWRELSSPMWPKGIDAETDCEWKLEAPLGQRVQVHFDQILLSDVRDEYENCLKQSIDLVDGIERKIESDYISFCGTHRPSIDFISTNETMRVFLKSNIKPSKVTGEERFLLKYRSTALDSNFADHVMGTVKIEKSGYRRFKMRGLKKEMILRGFEFDIEETKMFDSTGRMRSRVRSEYDPDAGTRTGSDIKAPTLLSKYDATEQLENVEGGGKMLAAVSGGALFLILIFAVGSVLCFKKKKEVGSPQMYCKSTKRYITVNA